MPKRENQIKILKNQNDKKKNVIWYLLRANLCLIVRYVIDMRLLLIDGEKKTEKKTKTKIVIISLRLLLWNEACVLKTINKFVNLTFLCSLNSSKMIGA